MTRPFSATSVRHLVLAAQLPLLLHGTTLAQQTAPMAGASGADTTWMAAGFILLAVGVAVALLELFIPSGGLLALTAAAALVGSVACFWVHDAAWGVGALLLYLAGSPVAILVGLKIWTHTPLARRMVLGDGRADDDEHEWDRSPRAQEPADQVIRVGVGASGSRMPLEALLGQTGTALTPMRPVGFIRVAGERIEAHAESGMIDTGTRVTVVECDGARVIVRPAPAE